MSRFHTLKVVEVRRETPEAVSVVFEVPENLKNEFSFIPGQYITIKINLDGEELRRSYSICSAPFENELRIAVKEIENGRVSSYFNKKVKAGDTFEVMSPQGNFTFQPETKNANLVLFAAGSGITPVFSILKTAVKEATNNVKLFYSNKTEGTTIFKDKLDELVNTYNNLEVYYIYTRQDVSEKLFKGRIDEAKCTTFINHYNLLAEKPEVYVCGPEPLIFSVKDAFEKAGLNKESIHFELFTTPVKSDNQQSTSEVNFKGESEVTVIMDGEEFQFGLPADGENILDAAIEHGVDAPFSCKGAVCCTCKAKVIEGKAVMDMNYALTDDEVAQGYVLTCQAHPASQKVVIDYDEI